MSAAITKSSSRIYGQINLCLAFVVIFAAVLEVRARSQAQNDVLMPPSKSNLLPVHRPDLTKLEADVREQLASSQNALAAAVKDPLTPATKLSEAYGMMGKIYQAYSLISPARECYLNATRLAPKDFRWVYLLGKLDQLEDRFDEAIRRYRIARALRPEYVGRGSEFGQHLSATRPSGRRGGKF